MARGNGKPTYQPTPEALAALAVWTAIYPLPKTAKEPACLKTLDDLHRIDGLPWVRIEAICRHAAAKWAPQGFIQSPAKLRKPTRSGELVTWEAIEKQMANHHEETTKELTERLLANIERRKKEQFAQAQ